MHGMYWGWRPLAFCVFIGVIVSACSDQHAAPTVPPTYLPAITLTLRIYASPPPSDPSFVPQLATPSPQTALLPLRAATNAGMTLHDAARDFGIDVGTLQALNPEPREEGQPILIPLPLHTPVPVNLLPPACYETLTDSLVCMGAIVNDDAAPVTQVGARVELYSEDGVLLLSDSVGLEQRVILPGKAAPYRTLLHAPRERVSRMVVSLDRAELLPVDAVVPVAVEGERGAVVNGRYVVEAYVHNPEPYAVRDLRVVVTVMADENQVVGYRVVDLGKLNAGESVPVRVEVLPHVRSENLSHSLHAEGFVE